MAPVMVGSGDVFFFLITGFDSLINDNNYFMLINLDLYSYHILISSYNLPILSALVVGRPPCKQRLAAAGRWMTRPCSPIF